MHRRRRFWLPVTVDHFGQSYAVSHDASDGGLLLVCNRELEVGVGVTISFDIPPGGPVTLRVSAKVVRVTENDQDPHGIWPYKIAVKFDEPVPNLEEYLARLDSAAARR